MPLSLSPSLLMSSASSVAFSPLSLFASGEQGAWYDPSDLSTMFQDTAGTTPVTATGQTVARINDKSGRGNHATQATAASRPIYGIEPFGGRRNLLVRTEEFDNAAWSKTNVTVTANAAVAPDTTTTADKLVETTANGAHGVTQTAFTVLPSTAYTVAVYAKASERSWIAVDPVNPGVSNNQTFFNLANGTVGTNAPGNTAVITALGDGWYRCSVTRAATLSQTTMRLEMAIATGNGTTSYTGDGTSGILIWGAQAEQSATATAYQRVTDQWNVTEAGVPSVSYLQCDGTDDFLVTGTITPGIDKAQVFAGVRRLAGTANQLVYGYSADPVSTAGSFGLRVNTPTAMQILLVGSTLSNTEPPVSNVPNTSVFTHLMDIGAAIGAENGLRTNGGAAVYAANSAGSGNFSNQPFYVGRQGGTTNPFNGRIYQMLVRFGANLSAAQISQMETWLNARTGAF